MPSFKTLEITRSGDVATVRLIRPDVHNRFDAILHTEFPAALTAVAEIDGLGAVILSADGRSFSAGGDLAMMVEANTSPALRDRLQTEALAIVDGLLSMPVPIIAAVQGAAIGLGATVITCCDMIVCRRDTLIADPHVLLGLVAGDGGILGWSQSVGILRARRYLLTGDAITGEQAWAMGLVTDLADTAADVEPMAEALAAKIAALPRGGVRGTKTALSALTRRLYWPTFAESLSAEMDTLAGEEVRAAVLHALQNQKPAR
jgi:enoyl-CoA hydratase